MDKSAIKNFAVRARNKLIEDIGQKAYEVGISQEEIKDIEVFEGGFKVKGLDNSKIYKKYEIKQRDKLISNIKTKGLGQVIEEVAYTWFNRFIALRFMEVNDYLPTGVRVLSSLEEGKIEPDIIREALNVDFDLNDRDHEEYKEVVYRLMDLGDTDDLYRYLLVKQCNQLGRIMPMVFEEIADYTELLLPDYLLEEGSVIRDLVESIKEEDYKDQVEIIGWMYQYYISEKKDEVFADLRKNKKITKENIPAATQLFTPKWIVSYMVENSLGRLWLDSHPDEDLQAKWEYYLEEADQEPEVQKKLDQLRDPDLSPENIKVLDPSMGSGHILVYAFDVLYDIYLKANYSERDIARLILEKNLYGLDIDHRAGQLAAFALMMKARSKNRRIFRRKIDLNVCSIQESSGIPKEAIDYFSAGDKAVKEDLEYIVEVFDDAKEYGSILDVKKANFEALETRIEEIKNQETMDLYELQYREIILEKLPDLIKQAKIMSDKYDVVCTNPPYMGRKGMNPRLSKYVDDKYPNSKADLFAVFMELKTIKQNGYLAMINQHSWMFLSSFERLREGLINSKTIYNMLHLGARAFAEIGGEVVQSTAFILKNVLVDNYKGTYIRLVDFNNAEDKEVKTLAALEDSRCGYYYEVRQDSFEKIPGRPVAYWASERIVKVFEKGKKLESTCIAVTKGIFTGDNNRFIRYWHEVSIKKILDRSWNKYSKGGPYRKWYGNSIYVVNWKNDAYELKKFKGSGMGASKYYNLLHIVWSKITTLDITFRKDPEGVFFDDASPAIILNHDNDVLLGILNSKVCKHFSQLISPTMNYQIGDIKNIPIIYDEEQNTQIDKLVKTCIRISKSDWDLFETSWDFGCHPILKYSALKNDWDGFKANKIEAAFNRLTECVNEEFDMLKSYEEELNRIFIEIYGLEDELTPEVSDRDITVTKIFDSKEDIYEDIEGNRYILTKEDIIRSLISYAVGCMFGRYSLDQDGLIFAGGHFKDKFKIEDGELKVNTSTGWQKSSINVTMDNILVIADDDYFEDDIVNRFVDFIKITFGEETLEENLDYIGQTLGQKARETSRQAIRRYFLRDFYKDHLRTYQKRPVYWQFDSGRQDGFKALIYMHRHDVSTVARVRTDYLHRLQRMYEAEVNRLDIIEESDLPTREKAAAKKKKDKINKQIEECLVYDQVIAHIANQKIGFDLDDGVKHNYDLFQGVEVPQGEGKKPLKADLFSKI